MSEKPSCLLLDAAQLNKCEDAFTSNSKDEAPKITKPTTTTTAISTTETTTTTSSTTTSTIAAKGEIAASIEAAVDKTTDVLLDARTTTATIILKNFQKNEISAEMKTTTIASTVAADAIAVQSTKPTQQQQQQQQQQQSKKQQQFDKQSPLQAVAGPPHHHQNNYHKQQQQHCVEHLFPHIAETHRQLRYAIAGIEGGSLEQKIMKAMKQYITGVRAEFDDATASTFKCRKLARSLTRTMDLIHSISRTFSNSHEYLYRISELVAIYISCELSYAKEFKEHKPLIANRISSVIHKHLHVPNEDATNNIIRMFVSMPKMYKEREVMTKIFQKFIPKPLVIIQKELPDKIYIQYLIVFYQWKQLEIDLEAQMQVIDFADKFMRPAKTLCNNSQYAKHLPNYNECRRTATKYILQHLRFFQDLRNASMLDNCLRISTAIVDLSDDDPIETSSNCINFAEIVAATEIEPVVVNRNVKLEEQTVLATVDLTVDDEAPDLTEKFSWLHVLEQNALKLAPSSKAQAMISSAAAVQTSVSSAADNVPRSDVIELISDSEDDDENANETTRPNTEPEFFSLDFEEPEQLDCGQNYFDGELDDNTFEDIYHDDLMLDSEREFGDDVSDPTQIASRFQMNLRTYAITKERRMPAKESQQMAEKSTSTESQCSIQEFSHSDKEKANQSSILNAAPSSSTFTNSPTAEQFSMPRIIDSFSCRRDSIHLLHTPIAANNRPSASDNLHGEKESEEEIESGTDNLAQLHKNVEESEEDEGEDFDLYNPSSSVAESFNVGKVIYSQNTLNTTKRLPPTENTPNFNKILTEPTIAEREISKKTLKKQVKFNEDPIVGPMRSNATDSKNPLKLPIKPAINMNKFNNQQTIFSPTTLPRNINSSPSSFVASSIAQKGMEDISSIINVIEDSVNIVDNDVPESNKKIELTHAKDANLTVSTQPTNQKSTKLNNANFIKSNLSVFNNDDQAAKGSNVKITEDIIIQTAYGNSVKTQINSVDISSTNCNNINVENVVSNQISNLEKSNKVVSLGDVFGEPSASPSVCSSSVDIVIDYSENVKLSRVTTNIVGLNENKIESVYHETESNNTVPEKVPSNKASKSTQLKVDMDTRMSGELVKINLSDEVTDVVDQINGTSKTTKLFPQTDVEITASSNNIKRFMSLKKTIPLLEEENQIDSSNNVDVTTNNIEIESVSLSSEAIVKPTFSNESSTDKTDTVVSSTGDITSNISSVKKEIKSDNWMIEMNTLNTLDCVVEQSKKIFEIKVDDKIENISISPAPALVVKAKPNSDKEQQMWIITQNTATETQKGTNIQLNSSENEDRCGGIKIKLSKTTILTDEPSGDIKIYKKTVQNEIVPMKSLESAVVKNNLDNNNELATQENKKLKAFEEQTLNSATLVSLNQETEIKVVNNFEVSNKKTEYGCGVGFKTLKTLSNVESSAEIPQMATTFEQQKQTAVGNGSDLESDLEFDFDFVFGLDFDSLTSGSTATAEDIPVPDVPSGTVAQVSKDYQAEKLLEEFNNTSEVIVENVLAINKLKAEDKTIECSTALSSTSSSSSSSSSSCSCSCTSCSSSSTSSSSSSSKASTSSESGKIDKAIPNNLNALPIELPNELILNEEDLLSSSELMHDTELLSDLVTIPSLQADARRNQNIESDKQMKVIQRLCPTLEDDYELSNIVLDDESQLDEDEITWQQKHLLKNSKPILNKIRSCTISSNTVSENNFEKCQTNSVSLEKIVQTANNTDLNVDFMTDALNSNTTSILVSIPTNNIKNFNETLCKKANPLNSPSVDTNIPVEHFDEKPSTSKAALSALMAKKKITVPIKSTNDNTAGHAATVLKRPVLEYAISSGRSKNQAVLPIGPVKDVISTVFDDSEDMSLSRQVLLRSIVNFSPDPDNLQVDITLPLKKRRKLSEFQDDDVTNCAVIMTEEEEDNTFEGTASRGASNHGTTEADSTENTTNKKQIMLMEIVNKELNNILSKGEQKIDESSEKLTSPYESVDLNNKKIDKHVLDHAMDFSLPNDACTSSKQIIQNEVVTCEADSSSVIMVNNSAEDVEISEPTTTPFKRRTSPRYRGAPPVQIVVPQLKGNAGSVVPLEDEVKRCLPLPISYPATPMFSVANFEKLVRLQRYIDTLMVSVDVAAVIATATVNGSVVNEHLYEEARATILQQATIITSDGNGVSKPLLLKQHADGSVSILNDNDDGNEWLILPASTAKQLQKVSTALAILQDNQQTLVINGSVSGDIRSRIEADLLQFTQKSKVLPVRDSNLESQLLLNPSYKTETITRVEMENNFENAEVILATVQEEIIPPTLSLPKISSDTQAKQSDNIFTNNAQTFNEETRIDGKEFAVNTEILSENISMSRPVKEIINHCDNQNPSIYSHTPFEDKTTSLSEVQNVNVSVQLQQTTNTQELLQSKVYNMPGLEPLTWHYPTSHNEESKEELPQHVAVTTQQDAPNNPKDVNLSCLNKLQQYVSQVRKQQQNINQHLSKVQANISTNSATIETPIISNSNIFASETIFLKPSFDVETQESDNNFSQHNLPTTNNLNQGHYKPNFYQQQSEPSEIIDISQLKVTHKFGNTSLATTKIPYRNAIDMHEEFEKFVARRDKLIYTDKNGQQHRFQESSSQMQTQTMAQDFEQQQHQKNFTEKQQQIEVKHMKQIYLQQLKEQELQSHQQQLQLQKKLKLLRDEERRKEAVLIQTQRHQQLRQHFNEQNRQKQLEQYQNKQQQRYIDVQQQQQLQQQQQQLQQQLQHQDDKKHESQRKQQELFYQRQQLQQQQKQNKPQRKRQNLEQQQESQIVTAPKRPRGRPPKKLPQTPKRHYQTRSQQIVTTGTVLDDHKDHAKSLFRDVLGGKNWPKLPNSSNKTIADRVTKTLVFFSSATSKSSETSSLLPIGANAGYVTPTHSLIADTLAAPTVNPQNTDPKLLKRCAVVIERSEEIEQYLLEEANYINQLLEMQREKQRQRLIERQQRRLENVLLKAKVVEEKRSLAEEQERNWELRRQQAEFEKRLRVEKKKSQGILNRWKLLQFNKESLFMRLQSINRDNNLNEIAEGEAESMREEELFPNNSLEPSVKMKERAKTPDTQRTSLEKISAEEMLHDKEKKKDKQNEKKKKKKQEMRQKVLEEVEKQMKNQVDETETAKLVLHEKETTNEGHDKEQDVASNVPEMERADDIVEIARKSAEYQHEDTTPIKSKPSTKIKERSKTIDSRQLLFEKLFVEDEHEEEKKDAKREADQKEQKKVHEAKEKEEHVIINKQNIQITQKENENAKKELDGNSQPDQANNVDEDNLTKEIQNTMNIPQLESGTTLAPIDEIASTTINPVAATEIDVTTDIHTPTNKTKTITTTPSTLLQSATKSLKIRLKRANLKRMEIYRVLPETPRSSGKSSTSQTKKRVHLVDERTNSNESIAIIEEQSNIVQKSQEKTKKEREQMVVKMSKEAESVVSKNGDKDQRLVTECSSEYILKKKNKLFDRLKAQLLEMDNNAEEKQNIKGICEKKNKESSDEVRVTNEVKDKVKQKTKHISKIKKIKQKSPIVHTESQTEFKESLERIKNQPEITKSQERERSDQEKLSLKRTFPNDVHKMQKKKKEHRNKEKLEKVKGVKSDKNNSVGKVKAIELKSSETEKAKIVNEKEVVIETSTPNSSKMTTTNSAKEKQQQLKSSKLELQQQPQLEQQNIEHAHLELFKQIEMEISPEIATEATSLTLLANTAAITAPLTPLKHAPLSQHLDDIERREVALEPPTPPEPPDELVCLRPQQPSTPIFSTESSVCAAATNNVEQEYDYLPPSQQLPACTSLERIIELAEIVEVADMVEVSETATTKVSDNPMTLLNFEATPTVPAYLFNGESRDVPTPTLAVMAGGASGGTTTMTTAAVGSGDLITEGGVADEITQPESVAVVVSSLAAALTTAASVILATSDHEVSSTQETIYESLQQTKRQSSGGTQLPKQSNASLMSLSEPTTSSSELPALVVQNNQVDTTNHLPAENPSHLRRRGGRKLSTHDINGGGSSGNGGERAPPTKKRRKTFCAESTLCAVTTLPFIGAVETELHASQPTAAVIHSSGTSPSTTTMLETPAIKPTQTRKRGRPPKISNDSNSDSNKLATLANRTATKQMPSLILTARQKKMHNVSTPAYTNLEHFGSSVEFGTVSPSLKEHFKRTYSKNNLQLATQQIFVPPEIEKCLDSDAEPTPPSPQKEITHAAVAETVEKKVAAAVAVVKKAAAVMSADKKSQQTSSYTILKGGAKMKMMQPVPPPLLSLKKSKKVEKTKRAAAEKTAAAFEHSSGSSGVRRK